VVAAPGWTLEAGRRPTQKWIAPVRVHGPMSFLLLAVWACPVGGSREKNYVGQTFESVTRHRGWFADAQPVVMCGDFNSNAIWDHRRKIRNHSAVVKLLRERKLFSEYHAFFSEEHGKETKSTYYFWHTKDRCFHIDYIFVPDSWASQLKDVTIGRYEDWRATSDHVPVVVDVAEVEERDNRGIAPSRTLSAYASRPFRIRLYRLFDHPLPHAPYHRLRCPHFQHHRAILVLP